jgi:nucleoside-diphosphate-sugar epimerase
LLQLNGFIIQQLKEKGKDVSAPDAYRASKTLAERAAWDFIEKEKPQFDLVTVNPPFVLGPVIHQITKPDSLNTSVAAWYACLTGKKTADEVKGPYVYL